MMHTRSHDADQMMHRDTRCTHTEIIKPIVDQYCTIATGTIVILMS